MSLIQFWNIFFEDQKDLLPNFSWYYNVIKSKSVEFPPITVSPYAQSKASKKVNRNPNLPIDYSDEEIVEYNRSNSKKSRRNIEQISYIDISEFNEKKIKLYNDLLVVLENIELTNSIINNKGDKEILKTMVLNLNQMENKFESLKSKLESAGEIQLHEFTDDLLKEIMVVYKRSNSYSNNPSTAGNYSSVQTLNTKCRSGYISNSR